MSRQGQNTVMPVCRSQAGVTLFELLVAVVLLGLVSTMIYSVLNVGISFSARGKERLANLAREKNLLSLIKRQVDGAWYDMRLSRVNISGGSGILRIVTRQPLLHRTAGSVLAVYRVDAEGKALYYLEKKDYYNPDYGEGYTPALEDMEPLYASDRPVALAYDPEKSQVTVTLGEKESSFVPKCLPPAAPSRFKSEE